MIHRVGACFLVSLLAVGCGVGNDEVEKPDPNPNGIVCTDAFKATGTFTPGTPGRPLDEETQQPITGCWPVGTWTFSVSRDPAADNILDVTGDDVPDRCGEVAGTQAAAFDTSYSFEVKREYVVEPTVEGYVETYVMAGTTNEGTLIKWNGKVLHRLKVTEGGGGDCEGGLELFSPDGLFFWNLKPVLTGTALTGGGDYSVYEKNALVTE